MAPCRYPGAEGDYYQVLGLNFDASEEDIRRSYHGIVRTLHPDRRRPGGNGGDALERFHQVQSAWRVLSDPTRRLLYDLRNFGRSSLSTGAEAASGEGAEVKLLELQKEQAERDVDNMEVQLQKVLQREKARRGVLVRKALYGNLRLRRESLEDGLAGRRTIEPEDLVGPVVEVAKPLQSFVEQSALVLPGGAAASKADLPGFYNPAPLDPEVELSLYVLYEFRNQLHEVLVGDRETLSLPLRRHALAPGRAPRGPFSPANVAWLSRIGSGDLREYSQARRPSSSSAADGAGPPRRGAPASLTAGRHGAGAGEEKALARAVSEYLVRRLEPPVVGPEEVTRQEFLALGATAGLALVAAACWLRAGGGGGGGGLRP